LSEAQQIDFIEKIDTHDLHSNNIPILEGDPFALVKNVNTRSGLVMGRRCRAIQIKNRALVFQFEDGETRALTIIPMEKTSNGMKFIRCQLPLRLIFAGTVHRSQGMTLQRAVIDYRTKFWEHGQLYVALSQVKSPVDLCILLPDDMDDFTIRPPVDLDIIQILETMES
jgi:ATP-dependent exoDNAse (exonuclease V) alpha subunit